MGVAFSCKSLNMALNLAWCQNFGDPFNFGAPFKERAVLA
jgi:hypothetical protein